MKRPPAHPRVALVATAVSATLLLAACGPGGSDQAGGTVIDGNNEPSAATTSMPGMPGMTGMSMPASAAGDAAPVATTAITISNFAFGPTVAQVKVGSTVTWTNQDTDPHTVTSQNGGPLQSPTMQKGDTYKFTFTAPGRYEYLCTIHPFMTATVVVTP